MRRCPAYRTGYMVNRARETTPRRRGDVEMGIPACAHRPDTDLVSNSTHAPSRPNSSHIRPGDVVRRPHPHRLSRSVDHSFYNSRSFRMSHIETNTGHVPLSTNMHIKCAETLDIPPSLIKTMVFLNCSFQNSSTPPSMSLFKIFSVTYSLGRCLAIAYAILEQY